MKKFENLSADDKTEYFWLAADGQFARETFQMLGVKFDEDWERKCKGELDEYFKKYHPAAYKKAVQIGYKISMGEPLAGTPKKGYKNVKKTDIITSVAEKTGATKKATNEIVKAYWDTIKETINKDSKKKSKKEKLSNITIPNVGSIRLVATKARKVKISGLKNAKKGKGKKTEITVPSKLVPKFYVSGNFLAKESTTKAKPKTRSKGKGTKSKRTKKE